MALGRIVRRLSFAATILQECVTRGSVFLSLVNIRLRGLR
jgi:hypothetical protein